MNEIIMSQRMPVLALRGLNVFPKMTPHFDVGCILNVEKN